jgi:queuosine precursor transporter
MKRIGIAALVCYMLTIIAANWLVVHVGLVTVAPGLLAPAGVFAAGAALTFRDVVQDGLGRVAVVAAIIAGASLSYLIAPSLAVASGVAFLVSEAADFCVYTPLRERGFVRAVVASNIVGLVVDSVLFLWLAFGSLAFLEGQVVGKAEMTLLAIPLLMGTRAVLARHAPA